MFEFMTVRELYEICRADNAVETDNVEYVELEGWVRTNRDSGKLGFIALNDGSYFRNCQVVYLEEKLKKQQYKEIWQQYCGFLDLSMDGYMKIQRRLMEEQIQLWSNCGLGQ